MERQDTAQGWVPCRCSPKEMILESEEILIVQDKWGEISIHPASPEGRKALVQFGPFAGWYDHEDK